MSVNREMELKGTFRSEHLGQVKNFPAINKRTVWGARVKCIKQAHKKLVGILARTHWEGPVPRQDPTIPVIEDKALRRQIWCVGVDDVQRSSRTLKFDDGSTASIDIDVGDIMAGNISEPIGEFELELETEAPERLLEIACEIGKALRFRLAARSKASRGYAILTGDSPQTQKYVKVKLAQDTTVELTTNDTESVHQMRVALRRLRAAPRLLKPYLPRDQFGWAAAVSSGNYFLIQLLTRTA